MKTKRVFKFFLFLLFVFPIIIFANDKKIETIPRLKGIFLKWERIELSENQSIVLVRIEDRCPISVFDGKEIYRGSGYSYYDKEIESGKKYCYGRGIFSLNGECSDFVVSNLTQKRTFSDYFIYLIERNIIIFIGPILIIILFFAIRISKKYKEERAFRKQIKIKNIEIDIFF